MPGATRRVGLGLKVFLEGQGDLAMVEKEMETIIIGYIGFN